MNIGQKIDRYTGFKKIITILTVLFLIIDSVASILSPVYPSNFTSFITLGFAIHQLVSHYSNYRILNKDLSKGYILIYSITIGFSVYYLGLNLSNFLT